jgi:exosortase/archaeosortase family protein
MGEGEVGGAVDPLVSSPPPEVARRGSRTEAALSPRLAEGQGKALTSCERQRRRALPRREIFIWAVAILFLNRLFVVVKEMPAASLETLVSDLLAIGVFQYIAWYAVFRLLGWSDPAPAGRLRDFLVTAVFCLPLLSPMNSMIWVAATGIAIYLVLFNAGDIKLRTAGIVLAALSVQELWGQVLFGFVALPLLRAEAAVVGTLLEAARPGTMWYHNTIIGPDGFGVVIAAPCSSFHNLSLAMLVWLTISSLRHQDWRARDFAIGAAIGVTMVLFNVIRICLMAWNIDLYHYWHDGIGAEVFVVGASLTVLLMSLYGSLLARRPT